MKKAYNLFLFLASFSVSAVADDSLYDLGASFPSKPYAPLSSPKSSLGALDVIGSDAYKLLMPNGSIDSRSVTFLNSQGSVRLGAEYGLDSSDSNKSVGSMGLVLDASKGAYGGSIGYRRSEDKRDTIQGRLSFKGLRTKNLQLDLVAERSLPSTSFDAEAVGAEKSLAFMVGAKYRFAPNAYVAGQFGTIDYRPLSDSSVVSSKDFSAFSLEAGYRLGEDSSLFISHTRKSVSSDAAQSGGDWYDENVNAIGFRYNW